MERKGTQMSIVKRWGLLCIGLMLMSLAASAQVAMTKPAQLQPKQPLISVNFNQTPLPKALHAIAEKVHVGLSYKTVSVPSKSITYKAKDVPVYSALDAVLEGTDLYYTLSDNRKVILIKQMHLQTVKQETVSGTVTDAQTGKPLIGVNILVVGTSNGTATDADGHYSLDVPSLQDTLRFSYIGYETKTVAINGRTTVDVTMRLKTVGLNELVVTGAGITSKKKQLGQSVSQVSAKTLKNSSAVSVGQVLQGRIPGYIGGSNGAVGTSHPIRLRGTVSLSQRNNPLIYIDGVRIGNDRGLFASIATSEFQMVNPENIKNVSVLKGAAAATLYGTEASSGVIQITTKSGGSNQPVRWHFMTQQGFSHTPLDRIPVNAVYDPKTDKIVTNFPAKFTVNPGHIHKYNLSVGGGTDEFGFYSSIGYKKNDGSLPTNSLKNLNFLTNVTVRPIEGMKVRFKVLVRNSKVRAPYPDWGIMGEYVLANPLLADPPGRPFGEFYHTVPGVLHDKNYQKTLTSTIMGSVRYNFLKGLTAHLLIGVHKDRRRSSINIPPGNDRAVPEGMISVIHTRSKEASATIDLTWEVNPSDFFTSNKLTVGAQSYWNKNRNLNAEVDNFPVGQIQTINGGTVITDLSGDFKQVISAGIFGQEQIGINDRLFITAGLRIDGNSTFGSNFGFQTYPHLGISWLISNAPFWDIKFLNQLRLRAAYGVSGLQPGVYDKLRTWKSLALLGGASCFGT